MRRLVVLVSVALLFAATAPAVAVAAAPTVNSFVVKHGDVVTASRIVPVEMNVSDAVDMRFSSDGGVSWGDWGASADTTEVVLPDADGEYTIVGEFRSDTAETVQASGSIVLDRQPPEAALVTDTQPNAAGWYRSAPRVWFTSPELPVVFYRWAPLDSWLDFYPGSTTESLTAPVGVNTLSYYARDLAGNESPVLDREFKVDETSPTVAVSGVPAGWTSGDVTAAFTGSDALSVVSSGISGYYSSLDGGSVAPGSSRTVTAEGTHTLRFWSQDAAGNESVHGSTTVRIDKTAPVTTADVAASYERDAEILLSAFDAGSGVASTQWSTDGISWHAGAVASDSTLGARVLYFRSIDGVGNLEAVRSVQYRVYSPTRMALAGPVKAPAYNSSGTVVIQLVDPTGAPLPAGKSVSIRRADGTWGTTVPTQADGTVRLIAGRLTSARSYLISFAGDDGYTASSTSYTFVPKARLTRSTSWKSLKRGKAYYAKGYIEPKHAKTNANKVKVYVLKRGTDKKYHLYKTFKASYSAVTGSTVKSRYSAKVVLKSKGHYKLVAYHAADSSNAATYGSADYFTVR